MCVYSETGFREMEKDFDYANIERRQNAFSTFKTDKYEDLRWNERLKRATSSVRVEDVWEKKKYQT